MTWTGRRGGCPTILCNLNLVSDIICYSGFFVSLLLFCFVVVVVFLLGNHPIKGIVSRLATTPVLHNVPGPSEDFLGELAW